MAPMAEGHSSLVCIQGRWDEFTYSKQRICPIMTRGGVVLNVLDAPEVCKGVYESETYQCNTLQLRG